MIDCSIWYAAESIEEFDKRFQTPELDKRIKKLAESIYYYYNSFDTYDGNILVRPLDKLIVWRNNHGDKSD